MKAPTRLLNKLAVAALAAMALLGTAKAENHALILWIGDYGSPKANLPGIDLDAANARKIALAMGVPERNITELSNRSVTKPSISAALNALTNRIARDDKVFIYYSGHGMQIDGSASGSKCTEGLVTQERALFEDYRMQEALNAMGAKASQVVMMNDSCFSGGAATKEASRSMDDLVPKFFPEEIKAGSVMDSDYRCGEAVNKMSRNLEVIGAAARGPQVLYIAASAANEVSYATRLGSVATLAWASCIRSADSNRSGAVDGEELRACAQNYVNRNNGRQTITVVGNSRLPLTFAAQSGGGGAGRVNPANTLEDIRATRDRSHEVRLTPASSTLRIRQDMLDFTVSTNRAGYLYLLQVGSDGKTFNLLFPNREDANNYIGAGSHSFPRPTWRVRAGGPVGTSYVLAVVSPVKKEFAKDMDASGFFPSLAADEEAAKTLEVIATGAAGGSGRIGASDVVAIQEVN